MKIVTQQQIPIEEIKEKLEHQFPEYKIFYRGTKMLVVQKSGTAGAIIMSRKNRIIVNEGFPTIGGQLLFVLFILISLLIAFIVFFAAFYGGQKKLRVEVADFLTREYGTVIKKN